ncbi:putative multiple ankyrin repeats single kh domain protein [Aspergillus nomiae NRRL 13137]|uniref:Putative multiple ankyrin repeats single kh domain protein n=1 Tax=Aspergillus nomiae NRRL (strain ATCC 15546 / NRRL 13137 / CBS 260.88 / M93) TaxID=1509407 RepID=A0A0L1JHS8_ASPN3|nr:putative multiple ankyrin repeats single kh domain protein [Aspergillus nomiae NRRL 13137]KNG91324.1 putative multiple ankyrin repeats single kh domain protein [Aspergillus nomiae NRRL 13137]
MATKHTSHTADSYTIGWIAALPIERAAATAVLDERHDKPRDFVQNPNDMNSYTWGRMNQHNIVIASLPAGVHGTTSAAITATKLLSSLPQIRIALLVGIGGGIARPGRGRDIRLGDIVVSQPQGANGGVIQYDVGKAGCGGKWERKGSLSKPPQILLSALANLQAEHELGESQILRFLAVIAEKTSRAVRNVNGSKFVHQGLNNDHLFPASYNHESGPDCQSCDLTKAVKRDERGYTDPEIHYGTIASGNTLVKDAMYRDKILKDIDEDCLCLEMEAAGLMDHFPCLVIRGISDYADSHKNDQWQRYASATAAAYGRELLDYVPTQELQETETALRVLESRVDELKSESHADEIRKWLLPPDPSTNLNDVLNKKHIGTGSWFLESEPFQKWKGSDYNSLWLHGIPGVGKTVLSASIIAALSQEPDQSENIPLLYFLFDFSDNKKQSLSGLVRSFVTQREDEALCATFQQMLDTVKATRIIIDALDECTTRTDLLQWIEALIHSEGTVPQLLVTSRKEVDIESSFERLLPNNSIYPIIQGPVDDDILAYVHERLLTDRGFERWQTDASVQNEIESELMKRAGGMWVVCQLDILQKCLDLKMLRRSLRSLPKTLSEAYGQILANIDEGYRDYAIRLLQFLTYSERPLDLEEAVEIMAIYPAAQPPFDVKRRMPAPRDIMRIFPSLVSLVMDRNGMNVHLSHFSVQQYLKSNLINASFPEHMADVGMLFQSSLNRGADVNALGGEYGYPLVVASSEGRRDMVALLLDNGARIDVCVKDHGTFDHGTPLHVACFDGHKEVVQLLLAKGANVNAPNSRCGTPLMDASVNGHLEVVNQLLE